ATARARKGRSGKPPCSAHITSWITSSLSRITTRFSSMASSRTSWMSRRWRKSGGPSGGRTSETNAKKILPVEQRFLHDAPTKGKPTAIVAHTIKGKGVSFMENNPKYHGTAPTPAEVQLALQELQ